MGDTEAAYQRAAGAYQQAVELEAEATMHYVQQPSEDTAQAFRAAKRSTATAQLVMNDRQKERLISNATLAQMAAIVGEELDNKVQVLEEGHVQNRDLLLRIVSHFGISLDPIPEVAA